MCVYYPDLRTKYTTEADTNSGPVYALDWCKQPTPTSNTSNGRPTVRLAAGSLSDDYRNQIVVLGPSDERILIEDDADGSEELVELAAATHGYPATSLQWQPAGWKGTQSELLASTGDILRVWAFGVDGQGGGGGYVGRGAPVQYSLTARHQLSGVCFVHCFVEDVELRRRSTDKKHERDLRPAHVLLVEHDQPGPHRHRIRRHHLHRLGHRGRPGRDAAHRARSRRLRRRLAAHQHRHLRLRRCRRLFTCIRPALARALDDSVRDARPEGVGWDGGGESGGEDGDEPAPEDMLSPDG